MVNINVISVQNKSSENDPIKLFLLIHGVFNTHTHHNAVLEVNTLATDGYLTSILYTLHMWYPSI